MAVVFAILKTIGMILLVLLALCLFLLGAALFVPVRYRITAKTQETVELRCQISWFLRAVYVVQETKKGNIEIRILGIPLEFFRKVRSFFHRTEKESDVRENPEEVENLVTANESDERVMPNPLAENPASEKKAQGKKRKKEKKRKKKGFSFDKISSIITFIRDPANKRGFTVVKREIAALFRYVTPDEVKGEIVFGTGDPCTTGWLAGAVSMIPFAYTEGLHVCPVFEDRQFRADGYVKGKARLIYMVRLVIRGYLDPDIKRWIDQALGK